MLLSRYGNTDLLGGDFVRSANIIYKAMQKIAEDKLFFRWVFGYQTAIPFEEFKNRLKSDDREADEILEDVKSIIDGVVM